MGRDGTGAGTRQLLAARPSVRDRYLHPVPARLALAMAAAISGTDTLRAHISRRLSGHRRQYGIAGARGRVPACLRVGARHGPFQDGHLCHPGDRAHPGRADHSAAVGGCDAAGRAQRAAALPGYSRRRFLSGRAGRPARVLPPSGVGRRHRPAPAAGTVGGAGRQTAGRVCRRAACPEGWTPAADRERAIDSHLGGHCRVVLSGDAGL